MNQTATKDPLGSAWIIIATLGFTVMNLCIKAAAGKFGFSSGELVFWRMSFAAVMLAAIAKMRGDTFATRYWKIHLNRSVIGTAAMLCLFYAVTHLPLATGVTLSYTSSIFLAVFSFLILKERIAFYTQAILVFGFIGVVLLLNPSFKGGQEIAALAGLAGGAMSGWAYLQVRELSLLGEPGWRVVFLPVGNQRRHVGGLGDADRLAFLICRGITLLGRYRAVRNHRPTLHDPRL